MQMANNKPPDTCTKCYARGLPAANYARNSAAMIFWKSCKDCRDKVSSTVLAGCCSNFLLHRALPTFKISVMLGVMLGVVLSGT
jgi:hypothetical protein